MKRIGTVTFHKANNYGAVLQTYALKQYLCSVGFSCDVLDYRSKTIEGRYKNLKIMGSPKKMFRSFLQNHINSRRYSKFDRFRNQYIHAYQYNEKDLKNFDAVICGSDQIWNLNLTKNDSGFFLDFVPGKRISYAASFGVANLTDSQCAFCAKYLSTFSSIAVREPQGAELVSKISGKKADVVVDPVFLLNKNEWIAHFNLKENKKKYILVYLFNYTKDSCAFVERLKQKTGMDVYIIDGNIRPAIRGGRYFHTLAPVEWVSMIMNASYVVTNSFHCTAFSILFERTFFEMPAANEMNTGSRITNLLDLCGLSDGICDISLEEPTLKQINWQKVRKNLVTEILNSKAFLNKAL